MKIVIINGSPRKNGATAKILKRMQEKFEDKKEVSVTYYNLAEYSLLDCSGCLSCYSKQYKAVIERWKELKYLPFL